MALGPPSVAALDVPSNAFDYFWLESIKVGAGAVWVTADESPGLFTAGRDWIYRIDPASGKAVAKISVGRKPQLAVDEGALWVTSKADGTVSRIDPRTNQVVATIAVGKAPGPAAVGEGAVWVPNAEDGTVSRIDPLTNQIVATIAVSKKQPWVGEHPWFAAVGEGAVWLASEYEGTVSRIDPRSNRVVATIPTGGNAHSLILGAGAVWVGGASIVRIDPSTNRVVASLPLRADNEKAFAYGEGALWVVPFELGGKRVVRVDPETNQIAASIELCGFLAGTECRIERLAVGQGAVWVTLTGLLFQIDPHSNRLVGREYVGFNSFPEIAVGEGAIWVTIAQHRPLTNDELMRWPLNQ